MPRYFKTVCLASDALGPNWVFNELRDGRFRFGWSSPGTDLRIVRAIPAADRTPEQRDAWRFAQFLLGLIVGDRIVVQCEKPMTQVAIAEVVALNGETYYFADDREDFNHVVHVELLTPTPIPKNARALSQALVHDLTKRGQYYEIDEAPSILELNDVVVRAASGQLDLEIRRDADTHDRTRSAAERNIIESISREWPAHDFERFSAAILRSIANVEVVEVADRGKGWDILIRMYDPLTGDLLHENVPVQCKNYTGVVNDYGAISDLKRAIQNSSSAYAVLIITGQLTPEFRSQLAEAEKVLTAESKRNVRFLVVDESRLAQLYFKFLGNSEQ